MIRRILVSMGLIAVWAFTQITTVQASDIVLTHQGRLLDASDHPVNGTVSITFKIYEAPTGGSPLWSEPHPTVSVQDGLFTEQLGELVPLSIDVLSAPSAPTLPRYLEIEVSGEPLLPRVKLASTPQAAVSSRVSGDISTGPGTAKLVGRSGSTTGTIRMAATPDSTGTTLGSDSNGDGIPESLVSYKTSGPRAGGVLSGMSGSTTGTIRMAATSDSTGTTLGSDSDGNGIPESSVSYKTSGPRAGGILSGMSGSTTGTIRMAASPDSAYSTLETDSDGDGVPESSVRESSVPQVSEITVTKRSGSTTGTIRMAASSDSSNSTLETDSDGDGIPESSLRESSVPQVSEITVNGRSGSTTGTIRMAATPDSAILDLGYSGSTTATIRMQAVPTSGGHPIALSGGAYCDGTNWVNASDKNSKENFRKVDSERLLQQIAELAISEWNYKGDSGVTHIGPTAQDFKKIFGVGRDDKSISTIDPSGIALAAIQALKSENDELRAQITELREMIRAQAGKQK